MVNLSENNELLQMKKMHIFDKRKNSYLQISVPIFHNNQNI